MPTYRNPIQFPWFHIVEKVFNLRKVYFSSLLALLVLISYFSKENKFYER